MAGFIQKFIGKWQVAVYMALVFGSAAFLVATLIPPKYKSDVKILIIQNNASSISAFESVNYLSNVLAEVAYTETFMADVLASPFEVGRRFSSDPEKRKDEWKNTLKIAKIEGTGIIKVSVFDTSKKEAEKIAGAVGWNFLENAGKYHGNSANIAVKIIDGPITSSNPAYPNVFLSALLGVLAGLFISGVLVFFYDSFDLKVAREQKIDKKMIKSQLERQMRARKNKKELDYAEDLSDFYPVSNLAREPRKTETARKKEEDKKEGSFNEVLLSSVLAPFDQEGLDENLKKNEEEARRAKENEEDFSLELKEKKRAVEGRQKNEPALPSEIESERPDDESLARKGNFLTKLYRKSIFADRKFSSQEKAVFEKDKQQQKQWDGVFLEEEPAQQVRKIVPPQEKEKKTVSSKEKKASAPENLPIFLDEKDVDNFLRQEKSIGKPKQEAVFSQEEKQEEEKTETGKRPEESQAEGSELEDTGLEAIEDLDSLIGEKVLENGEIEEEPEQTVRKETSQEEGAEEREPSEEEIKERLNKLLKGEL